MAPSLSDQAPARRKNTAADTRFIEAHAKEFRYTEDGRLLWTGQAVDFGSEFQVPPDQYRCRHVKRHVTDEDGQQVLDRDYKPIEVRCERWAMRGAALCIGCANGSERVRNAVRERIVGSADALVGRLLELALDRDISAADAIRAINSALDRAGIRGGMEITAEVPGWKAVLAEMMGEEGDGQDDGAEGS